MKISDVLNGVAWAFAVWGAGFTLDLIARADQVTSAQWKYLMSVPGGKWSWAVVFLTGALTLAYGAAAEHRVFKAAGYAVLGFGCGLIAGFYIVAPLVDTGLTTLGYWPWLLTAAGMVLLAVVHVKPRPWLL